MFNTRAEAKCHNETYYFTGRPCKHGHIDNRFTTNGSCRTCLYSSEATKKARKVYLKNNPSLKVKNIENKRKISRNWVRNNRGSCNANVAKYRAKKLAATPRWLTFDQIKLIKAIYINCPKGYHVDHIVPLQGKIVCGLHVPWNLQYLTAEDNISKGNRVVTN